MRSVQIRWEGPALKPWRVYWSGTEHRATPDSYETMIEAGEAARHVLELNPDAKQDGIEIRARAAH
jgi:hypothetical protein